MRGPSSNRRPSGARGRIAEVLAGARATLNEPSRPVTPASLEARVDFIPSGSDKSTSSSSVPGSSYLYNGIRIGVGSSSSSISSETNYKPTRKMKRTPSGGDGSLLLLDILDTVNLLETEIQSVGGGVGPLSQALHNMTNSVDKFAKHLKTNEYEENEDLCNRLVGTLCGVLDCTQNKAVRQQACRHIMRLQLVKYPTSVDALDMDTVRILLRTTRDLYLCAREEGGGEEEEAAVRDGEPDTSADADDFSSSGTDGVDDVMVRGGIDLILEFLSVVWSQTKDSMDTLIERGGSSPPAALKMFLEAAVHAAGTLRHYSAKETNRKRLSHMGVMQVMSDGIRTAIKVCANYRKHMSAAGCGGGEGSAAVSPRGGSQAPTRDESVVFSQLGFVMVQVVGAVRHFSQDSSGKKLMLSSRTVCHICDLLHLFWNNPELCLNCVRVTAKLSLQDPFRSQLNAKPSYIASIARVIQHEADMCMRVINGDSGVVWPSWHTWPLLSRAAYTLGNMTTSNDSNRVLIATGCRCLKPLIMLLQTCGCSLMHLFSSSGEGGADSEDEDWRGSGASEGDIADSSGEEEEEEGNEAAEQELGEATIRLVRLFANIAINSEIGMLLAKRKDTVNMLLELLACSELGKNQDELQLNVVAACTNLTYYSCREDESAEEDGGGSPRAAPETTRDLQSMAARLSNYLFHENPEVVLEAARALGNLTRNDSVVEALCSTRSPEIMIMLLNSNDFDILLAVTGALVNISADSRSMECLAESEKPALALASVLRKSSFKQLHISTLICQVFHNLLLHEVDGFSECAERAVSDTLFELIDCAEDFDDEKYTSFITVGKSVLGYWQK